MMASACGSCGPAAWALPRAWRNCSGGSSTPNSRRRRTPAMASRSAAAATLLGSTAKHACACAWAHHASVIANPK